MKGEDHADFTLNGSRICFILLDGIEEDWVAARAVREKTEQLLENPTDRLPPEVLADRTEQPANRRIQRSRPKVPDKQGQATSVRQTVFRISLLP
jgi:hypothetical protein